MAQDLFISAIDVGSEKIRGMLVRKKQEGEILEVVSFHSLPSGGLRRGMVVNPDMVGEKIAELKKMFEHDCKREITEAYLNIGGYHLFSKTTGGAVAISRADQKVSQEDIDRVLEEARAVSLPLNKEVLDIYPKEYIIDGEGGIKNPLGLKGIKLEVEALATCAFSPYLKNLIESALIADLDVPEIIPSVLASSESVLTPQQKELGVVVVDIGAGSTGIAVFEEESLLHLAVLPMGSSHISSDIAIALKTEVDVAEKIKIKFGEHIFKTSKRKEKIEIAPGEYFSFPVSKMAQAGRARVAEILDLVQKELKKISKANTLPAGIVLTGGGSQLPGIVDFAKKELNLPARIGIPKGFVGIKADPSFSTVCGLVLKALHFQPPTPSSRLMEKIKKILKVFIP